MARFSQIMAEIRSLVMIIWSTCRDDFRYFVMMVVDFRSMVVVFSELWRWIFRNVTEMWSCFQNYGGGFSEMWQKCGHEIRRKVTIRTCFWKMGDNLCKNCVNLYDFLTIWTTFWAFLPIFEHFSTILGPKTPENDPKNAKKWPFWFIFQWYGHPHPTSIDKIGDFWPVFANMEKMWKFHENMAPSPTPPRPNPEIWPEITKNCKYGTKITNMVENMTKNDKMNNISGQKCQFVQHFDEKVSICTRFCQFVRIFDDFCVILALFTSKYGQKWTKNTLKCQKTPILVHFSVKWTPPGHLWYKIGVFRRFWSIICKYGRILSYFGMIFRDMVEL